MEDYQVSAFVSILKFVLAVGFLFLAVAILFRFFEAVSLLRKLSAQADAQTTLLRQIADAQPSKPSAARSDDPLHPSDPEPTHQAPTRSHW